MPVYEGEAKKLEDIDLPKLGQAIGVGEDVLHALIEVETIGTGFDKEGRVIILFEPHKFYANLRSKPEKRAEAVRQGLAYPKWGEKKYPKDSYPRLQKAMMIDEAAALRSCSWGMGQVMGDNYRQLGYENVHDMVKAFADDEEAQLKGMIDFIRANNIDDDLRRIENKAKSGQIVTASDWVPVVRVYNGSGYAKNNYHVRAANAFKKWLRIKDTPFGKKQKLLERAAIEEAENAPEDVITVVPAEGDSHLSQEQLKEGLTTSPDKNPEDTAGSPPPDPAKEIKASRPSLKSTIVAITTFILAPLSYLGIDTKEAAAKGVEFAQNNTALAIKLLVCFGFVVLAVYIWNRAMDRAHERTVKVMDAAANKDKNDLRLI